MITCPKWGPPGASRRCQVTKDRMLIVLASLGPGTRGCWDEYVAKLKRGTRFRSAVWLRWDYPRSRLATGRDAARDLHGTIINEYQRNEGYERIVLVGHSLGALAVRHAYLIARGSDPESGKPHAWGRRVTHMVLLAAPNRGVKLTPRFVLFAALHVGRLPLGALRDYRTSSDYMAHLAVLWARQSYGSGVGPIVTNIYAAADEWISPDDAVDPYQFRCAHQIAAPAASHMGILKPDSNAATAALLSACSRKDHLSRLKLPLGPSNVVILLHGIRTQHEQWTAELASLLKSRLPDWEVVIPKYGFMSALRFCVPQLRRRRLGWFKRTYLHYVSRNPNVVIHVVAHSNGTFLLGRCMQAVPSMRFGRVALLGSVLPADFSWSRVRGRGQLQLVRNERSCRDAPVALLCSGLRGLGMTDIGSSGYLGFHDDWPGKREVYWHRGGHDAALASRNLNVLADFVAGNANAVPPAGSLAAECPHFRLACRMAPVVVAILTLCCVFGLVAFATWGPWTPAVRLVTALVLAGAVVTLADRV